MYDARTSLSSLFILYFRVRPKLGFGYGFGAETATETRFRRRNCQISWFRPGFGYGRNSHFGFGLGFGYGRNSKFSFGIVTASRNSDIEFGKHGIILQPFPNAVSA